jgi:drug/metabolite transporter (DMT)-like permease
MSARAWTAFAAVSTLWGIPYLFIKVAVDDGVPPVFLAWARVLMAAAVLLVLSHRAGVLAPALEGPRRRAVGLAVGFAGVVALVGLDVSGSGDELLGALAILLAAVGYAAGPMVINMRLRELDPRALMAVALTIATALLTPAALLAPPADAPSGDAVVSIIVLGLFCTAAAFVLFGALIAEVGPGRATVITYISPIVAVALGVAVLGERPGAGAVAGLLLILAGSWLSTDGRLPPGIDRLLTGLRGRWRPSFPDRQAEVAEHPETQRFLRRLLDAGRL